MTELPSSVWHSCMSSVSTISNYPGADTRLSGSLSCSGESYQWPFSQPNGQRQYDFLPSIQTCKTFRQRQRHRLHAGDWCSVCTAKGRIIPIQKTTKRASGVVVAVFTRVSGSRDDVFVRVITCISQIISVDYPIDNNINTTRER